MTDRRSVCAPSAENLQPGVPYVRGWVEGSRGAEALAVALAALGLDTDFPALRADVNVFGDGVVHVGEVRPAAGELLARALATGLSIEMERNAVRDGCRPADDAQDAPPSAA